MESLIERYTKDFRDNSSTEDSHSATLFKDVKYENTSTTGRYLANGFQLRFSASTTKLKSIFNFNDGDQAQKLFLPFLFV